MVWFQCPETRPWSGWWPHPLCRPDSQRGWRSSCSVLWSQQKRSLVLEERICNVNRTVTYTFIQSTSVHAASSVCMVCLSKLLQYVVYVLWQNMKLAICAVHLGLANDNQESMGFKYAFRARRDYLYVIEYLYNKFDKLPHVWHVHIHKNRKQLMKTSAQCDDSFIH